MIQIPPPVCHQPPPQPHPAQLGGGGLGEMLGDEGGQHEEQEEDSAQGHGLLQLHEDFQAGPGAQSSSAGLPGKPAKSGYSEKITN